jgi:catechol 2,3-dioxygenase-like lactoylglutathione lyase family enzyme
MSTGKIRKATIGHVGIEVSSLDKAKKFYEVLAEALVLRKLYESKETIGWGNEEFAIWIILSKEPRVKRKCPTGKEEVVSEHLAIYVPNKGAVDAVDEVMKKEGLSSLFPPEELPQFSKGYYAASYNDPDNYVIEIYTLGK